MIVCLVSHIQLTLPRAPLAETVYQQEYRSLSNKRSRQDNHTTIAPGTPKRKLNFHAMTMKKRDLKPLDLSIRAKPIKRKDLEGSTGSMDQLYPNSDANTNSQRLHLQKDTASRIHPATVSQRLNEKFHVSNNRKTFKAWEPKTEFQGEIHGESMVDHDCLKDEEVKKPEVAKKVRKRVAPFYGQTTNKEFFPRLEFKDPVVTRHRKQPKPPPPLRKAKFDGVTSYSSDNPGFISGYPTPRRACTPHAPELDLFLPSCKDHFMSEQRLSYRQYNRADYHPPQPFRQAEKYVPPRSSLETMTSHKTHFPNQNVKTAKSDPLRPLTQLQMIGETRQFHDDTTNTVHFKHWQTTPRIRHGDHYERGYTPSKATHQMKTIYSSEFQPIKCKPATSCKPTNELMQDEDDFLKFEVTTQ